MRTPLLTLAAIGLAATVATTAVAQTTWLVSNDPSESPDFPGLWEALHSPAVIAGDTIEMNEGVGPYYPPMGEYYEIIDRGLVIRAQPGERPVLAVHVDLTFPFYTLVLSGGAETIIEGVEIKNGGQYALAVGGPLTLRNCYFRGTARQSVILAGGQTTFDACEFRNLNTLFGPSMEVGDVTFRGCLFTQSSQGNQGIRAYGATTFIDCEFSANKPAELRAEIDAEAALVIDRCRFLDTSKPDGAISAPLIRASGQTTITNTVFSGSGAAARPLILLRGTAPQSCSVVNCTFGGNAAVHIIEARNLATAGVRNCIIWNNALTGSPFTGVVDVAYSNVQGGHTGPGNINADPRFKSVAQDDFRLLPDSPCIDAGDTTAVPAGITMDLRGRPRFVDDPGTPNTGFGNPPHVDIGATEYGGLCRPDLTTTAIPQTPGFGIPDELLTTDDFFFYLLYFNNRHPLTDLTTTAIPGSPGYATPNGVVNNDDFFYYTALYAAGC